MQLIHFFQRKPSNILNLLPTFNLPSAIVNALYNTWKTAKKNMKMCNWCNAFVETSGTFPCQLECISNHKNKNELRQLILYQIKQMASKVESLSAETWPYIDESSKLTENDWKEIQNIYTLDVKDRMEDDNFVCIDKR